MSEGLGVPKPPHEDGAYEGMKKFGIGLQEKLALEAGSAEFWHGS